MSAVGSMVLRCTVRGQPGSRSPGTFGRREALRRAKLPGRRNALALAVTLFVFGAPVSSAADDRVVKLAPFIVEASTGVPWRYFAVPGFEVLSRCPDRFTETYARALQESVAARAALFPPGFLGGLPSPIKILLYCNPTEERPMFGPGNPIDLQLAPLADAVLGPVAIEQAAPVVVDDGDEFINCGNYSDVIRDVTDLSVDPDTDILLQLRTPTFPSWFKAGITGPNGLFAHRIIQTTLGGHPVARFPNASWISSDEPVTLRKNPKHPRRLLPLAALFDGSGRDTETELWNSEAALFVRWGLLGTEIDGTDHRESFLRFTDRATKEATTEPMFRECFGMGFDEAGRNLGLFAARAVTESITVPIVVPPGPPVRIRDARPDEIARIVGDWGRFEGRSASAGLIGLTDGNYRRDCLDHAKKLFERAYASDERTPLFLAAYGLYQAQLGEHAAARNALEVATAEGVVRPRAYLELARLRLGDSLPSAQQGIGDLGDADFAAILHLITVARLQMPSMLPCYQLLTRLLEHAPKTPAREELAVLGDAVHLFPRDAAFVCKVATLYQRCGYPDAARALVDYAKPFAESTAARSQLAGFALPVNLAP